jgi:hypothetical protein
MLHVTLLSVAWIVDGSDDPTERKRLEDAFASVEREGRHLFDPVQIVWRRYDASTAVTMSELVLADNPELLLLDGQLLETNQRSIALLRQLLSAKFSGFCWFWTGYEQEDATRKLLIEGSFIGLPGIGCVSTQRDDRVSLLVNEVTEAYVANGHTFRIESTSRPTVDIRSAARHVLNTIQLEQWRKEVVADIPRLSEIVFERFGNPTHVKVAPNSFVAIARRYRLSDEEIKALARRLGSAIESQDELAGFARDLIAVADRCQAQSMILK